MCYTEQSKNDSLHILYYDYKRKKFEHINDVSWIFKTLSCDEDTPLIMPIEGIDVFRHIHTLDREARKEILIALNFPFEVRRNQEIKTKYQRELSTLLIDAVNTGKIEPNSVNSLYKLLINGNYSSWEKEFKELYESFQRDQNINLLVMSLSKLIHEFKIEARSLIKKRTLPQDLVLIGCMFLVNPSSKDLSIT